MTMLTSASSSTLTKYERKAYELALIYDKLYKIPPEKLQRIRTNKIALKAVKAFSTALSHVTQSCLYSREITQSISQNRNCVTVLLCVGEIIRYINPSEFAKHQALLAYIEKSNSWDLLDAWKRVKLEKVNQQAIKKFECLYAQNIDCAMQYARDLIKPNKQHGYAVLAYCLAKNGLVKFNENLEGSADPRSIENLIFDVKLSNDERDQVSPLIMELLLPDCVKYGYILQERYPLLKG